MKKENRGEEGGEIRVGDFGQSDKGSQSKKILFFFCCFFFFGGGGERGVGTGEAN